MQLSNIGCEIILRGNISLLKQLYKEYDLEFVVPTYNLDRDKKIFLDFESNIIFAPMLTHKKILRGVLRKLKLFLVFWTPRFSSKLFKSCDVFVSVGGDIYTMFGGSIPIDWIGYERYATKNGIDCLMLGSNMEKFDLLDKRELNVLKTHLKRFKLISVRDQQTKDYLYNYNIYKNVEVYPDPIFVLRNTIPLKKFKINTIGINFTPIMLREFGDSLINTYSNIINDLVQNGYSVKLLPHVYSSENSSYLDDRISLKKIYFACNKDLRHKISLYDRSFDLASISEEINTIDMMIGGRMHSCLNALTLGKLVIFLSYSSKAASMIDWLKNSTQFINYKEHFCLSSSDELSTSLIYEVIENFNQSKITQTHINLSGNLKLDNLSNHLVN